MTATPSPTPTPERLMFVPTGKGCVLALTWAEYRAGVRRGKRIRRAQQQRQRQQCSPSPTPQNAPAALQCARNGIVAADAANGERKQ